MIPAIVTLIVGVAIVIVSFFLTFGTKVNSVISVMVIRSTQASKGSGS